MVEDTIKSKVYTKDRLKIEQQDLRRKPRVHSRVRKGKQFLLNKV